MNSHMECLIGHGEECSKKVTSHFLGNENSVILQVLSLKGQVLIGEKIGFFFLDCDPLGQAKCYQMARV